MEPIIALFLGSVTLLVGLGSRMIDQQRRLQKRQRFDDRAPLSVAAIFDQYYAESELDRLNVLKTWNEVANILELDPQKLRPSDRFDRELAPVPGYFIEDELADLEDYLVDRCRKQGIPLSRGSRLTTLDDLVILLEQGSSDRPTLLSI